MLAVLDAGPGAVISHTTAAAWWGLPGFDLLTIHITRPRGTTCAPAAYSSQVHEVLVLSTEQITVLDGVPIVRPERVIFELCATTHPLRAERALDTGWTKALYSGDSLRRIHKELACRGRGGTVLLRELLEARPLDWIPRPRTWKRDSGRSSAKRRSANGDARSTSETTRNGVGGSTSAPRGGRSLSRCRASATTPR